MTEMEDLVRRLEGAKGGPRTVDQHRAEQLQSWTSDLARLMSDVRAWLQPGEEAGVFFISLLEVELFEDDYGQYEVPALSVKILSEPDREVRIIPAGLRVKGIVTSGRRRITGVSGRVDLVSGPARAILLRFVNGGTRWELTSDKTEPEPFTSDALARVLAELVE